jgi:hypothetical protein
MLKSLLFASVISILTCLPALAENWVLVTRSRSDVDYYIDTESLQASNSTYLFWQMSVRSEPDVTGVVAEKSYISMSCPLRGFRVKVIARFNVQGELVNREEFGENEPLQFFTSDSIGEALWKSVCK